MPTKLAPGSFDDRVTLQLNGDEILIAESWDVEEGVFVTPAAFTLTLGMSTPVADYFTGPNAKYPKGSTFTLSIGNAPQMTGILEGFIVQGAATRITLKGRDIMSSLLRCHCEVEFSHIGNTYRSLVEMAIQRAGFAPNTYTLLGDNSVNRSLKAGVKISVPGEPTTASSKTLPAAQSKIDESLMTFVRRFIDRGGLFLWAGATSNTFILTQPNPNQIPIGQIVRKRGSPQLSSNVVDVHYRDDIASRHTYCTVYGRGGALASGRQVYKDTAPDPEMLAYLGNPIDYVSKALTQGMTFRDHNVNDANQAFFYAKRKLAEERRNGWALVYTVRGHRLPTPYGTDWGVITPDTLIHVEDDDLGINGYYYVESVRRMRRPDTVTEVRLMRPEDLVFGGVGG